MRRFFAKAAKTLLFTAAATLLLTAFASAADLATATGTVTGSSVRMRGGPSTSSEILTMLDRDYTVAVLDESLDGWYKIAYNGESGYISADYLTVSHAEEISVSGFLCATDVNVRSGPSTSTEVVGHADSGDSVSVTALRDGWYGVTLSNGKKGYIRSDFIALTTYAKSSAASTKSSNSVNRAVDVSQLSSTGGNTDVVALAKQYLGTRYVYGGASPGGFDCSGFTMYIFQQFGVSLPHSATSQWQSGKGTQLYAITDLTAGDLVFFNDPSRNAGKACSHAGIYIGSGKFIHSSSSRSNGVIISDLTSGYYNQYFVGGMRVL